MTSTSQEAPRTTTSHPRVVLAILCLTQLLLTLDDNVVNIALPTIQRELGFSGPSLVWVVNTYMLAFGGFLVLGGRLGDRYSLVRTFAAGTAVFALASLLSGLAAEPWQLIGARALQGLGAALVAPAVLGLLTLVFTEPAARAKAFAVWGATAVTGALAGLILSGVITEYWSWRWVFFINLPVAALALVLLPRLLRGVHRPHGDQALNWGGAALLTCGLALLVYALLSFGGDGGRPAVAAACAVLSLALLAAFAVDQRRSANPLVTKGVFASPVRARALVAAVLLSAATFQGFLVLTLYLQNGLGFTPLEAGLGYVPFALGSLTGVKAGERATVRFTAGRVLTVACAGTAAGALLLSWAASREFGYAGLLPGILLFAIGVGAGLPAAASAAARDADERTSGVIASLVNSSQQLGGAVGLALTGLSLGDSGHGFGAALAVCAAAALLACGWAAVVARREPLVSPSS
ncbi:MFS transporter [Streptomyces daghestanicus]|uniref:MFS transporter n=1 Tax=Streptomyces daghestanicus TaxID=66885 RepID=A0ABQ3QCH8_9ACTN|nr:MFS transporter [Streptomyces daghestanicus]GGU55917.1 MFS transporter [Streptomyces daghestanicus]GHI34968.1 MFS transporter [Streptomyces daghestanicus]